MDIDACLVDRNVSLFKLQGYLFSNKRANEGGFSCSGISLAAIVLNGLVKFCIPSYEANQWQTYVVYVAVSSTTGMHDNNS